MLIMKKGVVMSSGEGLPAAAGYAAAHKTKVKSVEICSTLGGFHELVVRWTNKSIGMFWTHDRSILREFLSGQEWPKADEYHVQALPMLLEPPAPVAAAAAEDDDPEEPEEPVRIRRTHSRPAPAPVVTPPKPPVAPVGRVRRAPRSGRVVDGDVTFI